MDEDFGLLPLKKLLCQTLEITEHVKHTLESQCEEAQYCLKPWSIRQTVTREINESMCTCSTGVTRNEIEEISEGISRTLMQSQQLREQLSLNIAKGKKLSKQRSVVDIYTGGLTDKHPKKNVYTVNERMKIDQKEIKTKAIDNKIIPGRVKVEKTQSQGQKKGMGSNAKVPIQKSSTETKSNVTNAVSSSGKKKNFLAINKQNLKNIKPVEQRKSLYKSSWDLNTADKYNTKTNALSVSKRHSAASTSELQNLLKKMSEESTVSSTVDLEEEKNNCPVHGNASVNYIEEDITTTVNTVEGLDRFNMPGEINKALKTYHSYLNNEFANDSSSNTKRAKHVNKFLQEFEEMNESMSKEVFSKVELGNILPTSIQVYKNAFESQRKKDSSDKFKKLQEELKSVYGKYDMNNFDIATVMESNSYESFYTTESKFSWMSNGVWNYSSINTIEDMSRVCCIRYLDTSQLSSLAQSIQDLQQTQYLNRLIEVILQKILPVVKNNFDPTKKECIHAYKMIYILCQGLNPTMPVLVKTDP